MLTRLTLTLTMTLTLIVGSGYKAGTDKEIEELKRKVHQMASQRNPGATEVTDMTPQPTTPYHIID